MALKFNKRIKVAPGVKLNIGLKGVSTTVGVKGASVNIGKKGTHLNAGIPGTGLSSRTKIAGPGNQTSGRGFKLLLGLVVCVIAIVLLVVLLR